jgi:hypothetical protein
MSTIRGYRFVGVPGLRARAKVREVCEATLQSFSVMLWNQLHQLRLPSPARLRGCEDLAILR